ncbi:amidase [Hasllibacter sp. MH4015]|uniref:amidase n=1 Tax=Hasllibacter sp. MH4015 TaxID=2854029 RepID=UPI001CD72F5C|nr:amidase [Hasllibacter sp. MH4015]
MDDLLQSGAGDLSRRIHARDISPVDLMRATLARIDAVNGDVNAIVSLRDREVLMGEARVAEAMARDGWLHGIPVAIKDLVAVRGVRSTWGFPPLADFVPEVDDGLARRLKAAGAIVIGKTNVPQFGFGSHSTNPVFGATRNPFNRALSAGGSSGGAAAALATGMLSIADGSDMMGSLRNPAAWNDVWGFRPSVGLVPGEVRDNVLLHRLSTHGPMARNVADLGRLLETLCERRVEIAAPGPHPRIAWLGDWGGAYPMEADLLQAGEAAVARAEDLGWRIEAIAPPFPADDIWRAWTDLRAFVVAQELGRYCADPVARGQLNAQCQWEIARGLSLTGAEIEAATTTRRALLAAFADLFTTFDALVLPATQIWPFPVEWDWPREVGGRPMDTYHRWMEVVVPASLAGLPSLGVPAGYGAGGLPHGLQLIGPHGADARILGLGQDWERMIGPRRPRDPA